MLTKRSLVFSVVWSALVASRLVASEDRTRLTSDQSQTLERWYQTVGSPRTGEPFGEYLGRTAAAKHGVGYEEIVPPPGDEILRVSLEQFECVSFIESSVAVARCGWQGRATGSCFERELIASRYRGGDIGDYASRLHYFTDWIGDNEARHRLRNFDARAGREARQAGFLLYYEPGASARLGSESRNRRASSKARLGGDEVERDSRRRARPRTGPDRPINASGRRSRRFCQGAPRPPRPSRRIRPLVRGQAATASRLQLPSARRDYDHRREGLLAETTREKRSSRRPTPPA